MYDIALPLDTVLKVYFFMAVIISSMIEIDGAVLP